MNFATLFSNVNTPVIVCREDEQFTVVYENHSAIMNLNPLATDTNWQSRDIDTPLNSILRFSDDGFNKFINQFVIDKSEVSAFKASIQLYTGENTPVSIYTNRLETDEGVYILIFLYKVVSDDASEAHSNALSAALEIAYKAENANASIENLLAFSGNYTNVSRVYIFEAVSDSLTSNTYEWCASGIEPSIDQLKNLPKADYSYDDIIANGLAVTDDIRNLSDEDRAILEPQGIKSLALIPIYSMKKPLGYIGFDDCTHYRKWTPLEVQFLQSLSDMVSSLIERRNYEQNMQYSLDVLKTITDNTDNMLFVVDKKSGEFLFANSTFADAVKMSASSLVGMDSGEILKSWCGDASLGEFSNFASPDNDQTSHSWDFCNPESCKWYLIRAAVIKWIDGRDVYLLNFTEITGQKEYAAELEYVATRDMMTGLHNRVWARQLIQQILDSSALYNDNSVVFIDLDNLKSTNDTYGHAIGDDMIKRTVELITSRIRKSDTLCRWGGDEFVLVLRAGAEQAERIMNGLHTLVDEHNATKKDIFTVGFSYGIVEINSERELTVDSIIEEADQKMYAQKVQRKGK